MAKIEVPQNNSTLDALLSVLRAVIGGCPLDLVVLETAIWKRFVTGLDLPRSVRILRSRFVLWDDCTLFAVSLCFAQVLWNR